MINLLRSFKRYFGMYPLFPLNIKNSRYAKAILLLLSFTVFNSPFIAQALTLIPFNIATQPADKALIAFGQQANTTLLFSYELTNNIQTNAINGHYPLNFALNKMLANTGLVAVVNGADEHAEILIKKQRRDSTKIKHPVNLKITPKQLKPIEKISVLGSRILGRSPEDLPVPVDTITQQRLNKTGEKNIGKALQTVAPSFNLPRSSISDGTDVLPPATLRGLGPDQVLVLVNGKRRHQTSLIHINTSVGRGTSGTDMSAIPMNAVEKTEVLRDGAASQYGSDAIAGVINITLKETATKGRASLSYGQYARSDGKQLSFEANKGFSLFNEGFINTSVLVTDVESTNRAHLDGACIYSGCSEVNGQVKTFQTSNPKEINADRETFSIGEPESKQAAVVVNSGFDLNENNHLYSFFTFSERENISATFFRNANSPLNNPILPDGDAFYPDGFLPKIHSTINDTAFSLGFKSTLSADSFIDFSYTYGKNTIQYETRHSLNASYVNALLNKPTPLQPDDIRRTTPKSAFAYETALSLQTLNVNFQHAFSHFTLSAGAEYRHDDYEVLPGEKYSYTNYFPRSETTLHTSAGIEGFGGINEDSMVNKGRNVQSVYVDIDTSPFENLTINTAFRYDNYQAFSSTNNIKVAALWKVMDNWYLRSAYSTGFRAPSMQQLYTTSVSTQFVNTTNDAEISERHINDQQPLEVGTFGSNSTIGLEIGLPQLKEETSKNISLGTTFTLDEHINVTVDYYSIYINNRVLFSKKITELPDIDLSTILADVGAQSAQFFINGANTHTTGVDIIATWAGKLLGGNLDLTLAANHSNTAVCDIFLPETLRFNNSQSLDIISSQDISIIEEWQPQDKVHFNGFYNYNNWTVSLSVNRYGEYTIKDGGEQTFSPKVLTDVNIEYQLSSSLTLNFGGNNIFDAMPDKNTIGNSHSGKVLDATTGNTIVDSDGVFEYSRRAAPFGFNGAYFYTGMSYHF